jgi:hypothetical protein
MSSMGDLASALQGVPGGAQIAAQDASSPLDQNDPDEGKDEKQYTNSLDALDDAEDALEAFIQLDPDEGDRAGAAKALQIVLGLKAANQKSGQAGDLKSLARALQGGGPGGGLGGPGGPGGGAGPGGPPGPGGPLGG